MKSILGLALTMLACLTLNAADWIIPPHTISGTESYGGESGIISSGVVISTTGQATTFHTVRAAFQPSISVQTGGRLTMQVTNQPPVIALITASSTPVTGTTINLSAMGADDNGPAQLTYTWTKPGTSTWTSGNTGASVGVSFSAAGAYTFQVTVTDQGGLSATGSIDVSVVQSPSVVHVTPQNTSTGGTTQQFSATTLDQFNTVIPNAPVTWTVVSGNGYFSANDGLLRASAIGAVTIRASATNAPALFENSTVTFTPTGHLSLSPSSASVVVTEQCTFSATALDQFNAPMSPPPVISLSVTPSTVGTIAGNVFTAGPTVGGPYPINASSTGYASVQASVTLTKPPQIYLTFDQNIPSLTTSSTDTALGRGWIKSVNGQVQMVPDMVNTSYALGNGNIIKWFAKGPTQAPSAYLSTVDRPDAGSPYRYDLTYGYISGPANRLAFIDDTTAPACSFYLIEATYDSGTTYIPSTTTPINVQLKGYIASRSQVGGLPTAPFAKGRLTHTNYGTASFTAGVGNAIAAGIVPNYSFSITPQSTQSYASSAVSSTWSGICNLPNTTILTTSLNYLQMTSSSGGQRFVISYNSVDNLYSLGSFVASNGIAVLGILWGQFYSQQIAPN